MTPREIAEAILAGAERMKCDLPSALDITDETFEALTALSEPPTIVIGIGGYDLPQVSGAPANYRVIVRDFEHGNEPDENGDLYEDTVIQEGHDA